MTVPAVDTIGGVTFDDPHRRLEEDTPETRRWQERADGAARETIGALPALEALREATLRRRHESLASVPAKHGERWFRLSAGAPGTAPVLAVGASLSDPGRALVDPNAWPGTEVSLDWFYPAPDGAYVAFGISERGDEQSVLHVVEVDSGELLPDRVAHASFGVVAWLPDSSGFFYNAGLGPDTERPQKHVFFHRLGDERPASPEPAPVREDEEFVFPQVSPDGRWVMAVSSEVEPRPDSIRPVDGGDWRPFLLELRGTFAGCFHGDRYLAVTTDGAPRGRLVSIPLESPGERSTWSELVPEGEGVLRSVCPAGDGLVLVDLVDTCSRIRLYSLDGRLEDEVPLPGEGTVGTRLTRYQAFCEPMVSAADGALLFVFSTFSRPPCLYRYDLAERRLEALTPTGPEIRDVVSEFRRCTSMGGTEVSYWLVRTRRAGRAGPGPTLLYGYGGWNLAFGLPTYLAELAPFVEAGGALAFPHLRGGSEHGESHWHDGRLERKQHTFDDLYAVAEALVAEGVAAPDRLGVVGESNGGLLAAAALTQRPDLFRVTVPLVPLVDLMRYTRDPYPAEFAIEYGDPADPSFAPVLHAYSPYHNVRAGERYPATLVVCGDSDIRCPAWQGRKLVARLQEANASDHPVLLRVLEHAGHLSTTERSTPEWLAFVMAELGMMYG
jgi:prolyl oligopeptidase